MKEQITNEDITIQVRGFFYKIPYYVLADDPDIQNYFGLVESDADELREELADVSDPLDRQDMFNLDFIRAIILLKPEQYYSYRYVKLNDHDDAREAMLAFINQFEGEDDLMRLRRELTFFAGAEWKQFAAPNKPEEFLKSLKGFLGGMPSAITFIVPDGTFWKCSNYVGELLKKHNIDPGEYGPFPDNASTAKPYHEFTINNILITIRENLLK